MPTPCFWTKLKLSDVRRLEKWFRLLGQDVFLLRLFDFTGWLNSSTKVLLCGTDYILGVDKLHRRMYLSLDFINAEFSSVSLVRV